MGLSEWPVSRLLARWLLVFSGKKPLYRLSELPVDPQEICELKEVTSQHMSHEWSIKATDLSSLLHS